MTYHRCKLVRLVADARVVTDGDPFCFAHLFQPNFIWAVRWEMVAVPPYFQSRSSEDFRESRTEVAIGEEYKRVTRHARTVLPA